jgi:hypothetical protein
MRFSADDFQGLTPSVDARKSEKLFALGGRNYVFDSFGPRSVFGNRYVTPYPLGAPESTQGIRLRLQTGDHVFVFTSDCILEWSESLGGWRVLYYFTANLSDHPYRWTWGYLSGIMFFCHPGVGILAYEIASDSCLPLSSPGVPDTPIAICQCSGRIIAINDIIHSWSAPGDGTNWLPELGGAGFQEISARVPGIPIMIESYGAGTLTWTSGGVMRSEYTADAAVFRHRALVTEYRPINSFCTFQQDNNTVVLLDERGFFASQGDTPQPLTPVFNEFLIDYLQRNNLKLGTNCRVEYDDLQRRVYLSVSQSYSDPKFEKAFVLYTSLDKWGTFDETHYGILPLLITSSSRADDFTGFVDSDGRVRFWNFGASREILPLDGHLNSRYPLIQKPAVQTLDGEAVILGSSMELNTFDTSAYTQRAGFYGSSGLAPAVSNVTGLDSVVQLGFVRARGDDSYDRLIEISQIQVGSILANPFVYPIVDYNLVPDGVSDEDYNAEAGAEDFGIEDVSYTNHGIRVIPTIDGRSAWNEPSIPDLITFSRATREYSCSAVGLWNILELSAYNVGEAYHVRTLEITALDAGRLN